MSTTTVLQPSFLETIPQTKAPRQGEAPLKLEELEAVADSAGHGHGHMPFASQPNFWLDLSEQNCRPIYDARFVQCFNPQVVGHLIDRIRAAEDTIACPDIEAAAKALHARKQDSFTWEQLSDSYRQQWRDTAQVALEAALTLPDPEAHRIELVKARHAARDNK